LRAHIKLWMVLSWMTHRLRIRELFTRDLFGGRFPQFALCCHPTLFPNFLHEWRKLAH
jgi:hypothetical protein